MPDTNYFWDPLSDNILQERDEAGAVTAEYTTEPGLYGNLISQNQGGLESQYHFDALGSTLALSDDDQQVTDTYAYSAFGEVTEQAGSTINPFQYVGARGYYADELTGKLLVRRRPLSVQHARWLAAEVVISIAQLNRYLYAANCPWLFIDPSGEDFIALAHYYIRAGYHYSLERWICCQDPTDPDFLFKVIELISRDASGNIVARHRPDVLESCFPDSWVELSGRDLVVDVDMNCRPAAGKPRQKYRLPVPVAVIHYNRADHGPIDAIMPVYAGSADNVTRMWNIILDLAEGYTWAEQERKEGLLKNWARSMYWARGTNSRTFVVYLLEESGIGWRDMPGPHIGNDAPTQNPPNEPDLTTIYQFDCELIGDGSPGAPRPRRPQK